MSKNSFRKKNVKQIQLEEKFRRRVFVKFGLEKTGS